jgi:NADH-quinone oxidoreductase subunit L
MESNIVVTAVGVPLLGSFLIALFGQKLKQAIALILLAVTLVCTALIVGKVASGQSLVVSRQFTEWMSVSFIADRLSGFMAVISAAIGTLIGVYSIGYMRHYSHQREYYFFVVLFIGAMMGLVFSANLLLMYVFWEITAICSWRLIGFYRESKDVIAADKSFLMTFFGASLMLIGMVLVYNQYHTLNLIELKGKDLTTAASILILAGILSKSAQLPIQVWLPDAGVAPSPVTALLHAAVLVKIGVYAFARIFLCTFAVSAGFNHAVAIIAVISAFVAGGAALIETDIKRILAYSTISQIGCILLGFALGTPLGFAAGLFYLLVHAIAKGGLFLCAGIVEHNTGIKDIRRMGGLAKTMPVTAVSFLFCAFSIIGIPPFGGFYGKLAITMAAVGSGHTGLAVVFMLTAVLTLLYLLRLFNAVFAGGTAFTDVREGTPVMLVSVCVFGILSLVIGLFMSVPMDFVMGAMQ